VELLLLLVGQLDGRAVGLPRHAAVLAASTEADVRGGVRGTACVDLVRHALRRGRDVDQLALRKRIATVQPGVELEDRLGTDGVLPGGGVERVGTAGAVRDRRRPLRVVQVRDGRIAAAVMHYVHVLPLCHWPAAPVLPGGTGIMAAG